MRKVLFTVTLLLATIATIIAVWPTQEPIEYVITVSSLEEYKQWSKSTGEHVHGLALSLAIAESAQWSKDQMCVDIYRKGDHYDLLSELE